MKTIERDVALKERPEAREAEKKERVGAEAVEKKAEKPEMSEEIMIEEINIDGMCGVY